MGHHGVVVLIIALVALTPLALAGPLVGENACGPSVGCVGGAGCDTNASCSLAACQNVSHCGAEAQNGSTCAINETIAGHTCTTRQGVDVASVPEVLQPFGITLGHSWLSGGASQSEGNVTMFNSPNSWTSDAFEVGGGAAGADAPTLDGSFYTSTIQADSHTFTVLDVSLDAAGAPSHVVVRLLDNSLEGCAASSDVIAQVTFDCRDVPSTPLGLP